MSGLPPPGPAGPTGALRRELRWRRLDVRMLLVHPVQEAVRFLPALALLFVSGRSSDRSPWWDLGALAFVVLLGMSRWFTTSYRIGSGQVELRTGLVRRVRLATPTDRVRSVDVTASIWHRLLGLARVEIGTGGGGVLGERIVLDALAAPEAEVLRADLLHRGGGDGAPARNGGSTAPAALSPQPGARSEPGGWPAPVAPEAPADTRGGEELLLALRPQWVGYAPLTTRGLLSALALYGFGVQYSVDALDSISDLINRVVALGAGLALLIGLVAALVAMSVLAMSGYVLSFWGLRLTRHPGGTLQVRRGLLTTRATSIEEARMRGVELGEPLGLRWAGAARLLAITTGLGRADAESGATVLSPPAPLGVVTEVAVAVCSDREAVAGPLHRHGAAARRRRHIRAIMSGACLALGSAVATLWWHLPVVVLALGALPLLTAPLLAQDRYAALGHRLTAAHLVTRSGSFERHRAVLARTGVVGVVVRQSFFQRRSGLATLTVTTAAGRQGYHVVDVPLRRAWTLARELSPAAVGDFVGPGADTRAVRRGIVLGPLGELGPLGDGG